MQREHEDIPSERDASPTKTRPAAPTPSERDRSGARTSDATMKPTGDGGAVATVRIVDIARMAGVSTATVDRVIHNRGKVSAGNLARIREVLERVDYRPNLIARSLASGRRYAVAVVMPRFAEGDYWADFEAGIARAEAEARRYNVEVHRFYFDQYDRTSFDALLERLRAESFDGVLLATLFAERVIPFAGELDQREIPYVFVDSDLPECHRLAYYGTSSFDAGVLAARLLFERLDPGADIVVGRILHHGDGGSNQCRERERGFRDYLARHDFRGTLHHVSLRLDDGARNARMLDELFDCHRSIAGAVTFNSTCHILGGYLAARQRADVRLVGYDVIARNRRMLEEGVVTALVAQRPEMQGYCGVMALCGWLVEGRRPAAVNNLPIDILLRENISYYTNNIN